MAKKAAVTFGARLQALREAAGMTRPELADKTGLTRQYVWMLEGDQKQVSWDVVLRLAAALGKTPNDFR